MSNWFESEEAELQVSITDKGNNDGAKQTCVAKALEYKADATGNVPEDEEYWSNEANESYKQAR